MQERDMDRLCAFFKRGISQIFESKMQDVILQLYSPNGINTPGATTLGSLTTIV